MQVERVLQIGEKIYVITRRGFDGEIRRHFIGVVESSDGALARVRGYAIVYDDGSNQYMRRPEKRVRIFGLSDSNLIISVLPESVSIDTIRYEMTDEGRLFVTDGGDWRLDINEFNGRR